MNLLQDLSYFVCGMD